jgi:hypothetical protein
MLKFKGNDPQISQKNKFGKQKTLNYKEEQTNVAPTKTKTASCLIDCGS